MLAGSDKIAKLKRKINKETDRYAELNSWGLNSYCIALTLKVRTLEDLIDCAQRCQIKSDSDVQRELMLMTMLRDRLWKDVNTFLDKKDINLSERMQVLSLRKRNPKQKAAKDQQNLKQLLDKVAKFEGIVKFLDFKFSNANQDLEITVQMAREMVELCSLKFG